MKEFTLAPRAIPLDDSWDVIVVGGGPAGCAAATAAAREGAKTLLIEQTGSLGGMGTSALVPAWTPFSDKEKIIYRGIAEKVFTAAKSGMKHVKPDAMDWVPIDAERLKRVYDDLVTDAGATVLFNTFLSAVETDDNRNIRAVLISNKAGLTAKSAKVYIDTTGDADLCAFAGAAFDKGDETGGNLMPATHCFVFSNVNEKAYLNGPYAHSGTPESQVYKIIKSGKYPIVPDSHLCSNIVGPGTVGFNAGHVFGLDNTNPESTSKGLMLGRKIAAAYLASFAEFAPEAYGEAFLVQTGSMMGVRETRRVVGDYVLTLKDYMARASFDDEICRNSYYIDVHIKVKEAAQSIDDLHKWEKTNLNYGKGESHGIPYRSLIPRDLRNALVAGRCISAEQLVQGSVRVMPCCLAMGEGAGLAGALAAKKGGDVRAVDIKHLRRRLREEGAYLPPLESEKSQTKLPAPVGAI